MKFLKIIILSICNKINPLYVLHTQFFATLDCILLFLINFATS